MHRYAKELLIEATENILIGCLMVELWFDWKNDDDDDGDMKGKERK